MREDVGQPGLRIEPFIFAVYAALVLELSERCQRCLLEREVGMQVGLRRLDGLPEPQCDHGAVHPPPAAVPSLHCASAHAATPAWTSMTGMSLWRRARAWPA